MSGIFIDRRKNPQGRNLPNRRRFLERAKAPIRESAKRGLVNRGLRDKGDAGVSIPTKGIGEPRFVHDPNSGEYDYILPGNHEYVVGDTFDKPRGGGRGRGTEGSRDGSGEDDFIFTLTRDEWLELVFGDLELPDMVKKTERHTMAFENHRAGFTTVGAPSNLDVEKTLITSLSRRIALKYPKLAKIRELERQLEEETDETRRQEIKDEIEVLRRRAAAVNFIEHIDLRYRNYVQTPKPTTRAVMFCLMDVSGSMTEREKTIAKKFFLLLALFLERRYEHTDIVFIRHTHEAKEVDEDTFFHSPETGGTVVSTAYVEARKIINERYSPADWNIYFAQASDGDNTYSDNLIAAEELRHILPLTQYFAFIEIGREYSDDRPMFMRASSSGLWDTLESLAAEFPVLNCKRINSERDIVQVFRSLFQKNGGENG